MTQHRTIHVSNKGTNKRQQGADPNSSSRRIRDPSTLSSLFFFFHECVRTTRFQQSIPAITSKSSIYTLITPSKLPPKSPTNPHQTLTKNASLITHEVASSSSSPSLQQDPLHSLERTSPLRSSNPYNNTKPADKMSKSRNNEQQ